MSKVSYANMKLKTVTSTQQMTFNDFTIEVLDYLPIEDKYDLIMITLQKSKENGIYNPIKLDMYFHLHLVYMYTNISFTDKQKENESKLYDALVSCGFMDKFIETINEEEYNQLYNYLTTLVNNHMTYSISAGSVLSSLVNDLPKNAEAAAKIVDSFDPKKYSNVINLAKMANNGQLPQ